MPKEHNPRQPINEAPKEFEETVLQVDRVSRTVKGGRRIRFRALVIIGNKNGRVGIGMGKAAEVATAVSKASRQAKKQLIDVPIIDGTIPHEITSRYGSAQIILKPAPEGTSVIAGSAVRTIAELAGIRNLVAKIIGDASKINIAEATLKALNTLRQKESKGKE